MHYWVLAASFRSFWLLYPHLSVMGMKIAHATKNGSTYIHICINSFCTILQFFLTETNECLQDFCSSNFKESKKLLMIKTTVFFFNNFLNQRRISAANIQSMPSYANFRKSNTISQMEKRLQVRGEYPINQMFS